MNPPDYTKYSIPELFQALEGIDKEQYKDRVVIIENEINYRKEAGYVISAETSALFNESSVSFDAIAMPVWWSAFWRTTVAECLLAVVFWVLLVVNSFIGIPSLFLFILFALVQLVSIPYIGAYCMRQALVTRYNNFQISIVPNTANKSFQLTAEAATE
ncbi:hypothetical protein [Amphritea sp.]|uniref:hypothetical protein n=1 Tax=Amphritea sp. TaxID=1872502 RepID=UPI0025C49D36|nr:hypothetical protein [Amphritea sp.]